jgi:MinD superfamily P-loop ATPase
MDSYVEEQGYDSISDVIGLGQKYIMDNENIDMMPGQTIIEIDHDKYIRCMRCVDNICKALYAEKGVVKVHEDRCAGCGGCTIACQSDALKVVLKK